MTDSSFAFVALLALPFVLPAAGPLPASVAASPVASVPADVDEPGARLAAALDAVQADNVSADVHFLASDALGGRDTPSEGLRVAARYIRARLQRLGFEPGASDGYFYRYPLEQKRYDEATSSVVARAGEREESFAFGRDVFLVERGDLADSEASGTLVFCGAGDDFDGIDVAGKWALCFDDGSGSISRGRLRNNARRAGACGLVVTPGPGYAGEPYAHKHAADTAQLTRGVVSWRGDGGRKSQPRELFHRLYLAQDAARRLVALAGRTPESLERGAHIDVALSDVRVCEGTIEVENVCGFWPGSDPELAQEVLIVSAHYDHVGTQGGEIFNGADDNGSGTAGLLALAEALAQYGPMRRSVLLIWVSGEELGLWGSKAWAANPWLPEGKQPVADINIDMIGRNAPDSLLITPTSKIKNEYNGLTRLAEKHAPSEGFGPLGSADEYWLRSDHASFAKLGIPVAFLFADVHDDYHKPTDTPDKLDYDKIRRVTRLVLRMLDSLQTDRLDL